MRFAPGVLIAALLLTPGTSSAQGPVRASRPPRPDESRIFIDVNLSGQSSSVAGARVFTSKFVKFSEAASATAKYPKPGHELSPLADVGGTFMLSRFLGVGASYSRVVYDDGADLSTTIPHPTFYGSPATSSVASDRTLERVEASTNFFVSLSPVRSNQLHVRLFVGPTYFSYKADMVQEVSYAQVAAPSLPQNSIAIDGFTSTSAHANAVGVHVAGEVAYFFSKWFGAASGVRFSSGLVTLPKEPLSGLSQQVRVGGTVVFVGARVRLGG